MLDIQLLINYGSQDVHPEKNTSKTNNKNFYKKINKKKNKKI